MKSFSSSELMILGSMPMISPTMPMSMISGALPVNEGDDCLVDLADEHHLDDVQGLLVGDAHAAHVAAGDPHLVQHRVDLRPAAVHDHGGDTEVFQHADVLSEAFFKLLV